MKRIYRIILSLFIGILGICILYFAIIPAVLMSNFFIGKLSSVIYKKTGFELNLSDYEVKPEVFPLGYSVKTGNILLENKKYNEVIKVDKFNAKIRTLPLFIGLISVNNGMAGDTYVVINQDYTETVMSPKLLKKLKRVRLKDFNLSGMELDISGQKYFGNIKINIGSAKFYEVNLSRRINLDTDIALLYGDDAGYISLSTDLKLPLKYKNIKSTFLKSNVNNLRLEIFSKFINKIYDEIETTAGTISATVDKDGETYMVVNSLCDNIKINFKDDKPPIYLTKPLTFKSNMIFADNKLDIKTMKVLSELIKGEMYGYIDLSDMKNIKNTLTVSIDKSDLSEAVNLLPPLKDTIEEFDLSELKKNVVSGKILGHLDIDGDLMTPDVTGNILVSDLYVVKPIKNARKATVKLLFNGDNMTLDTFVPTAYKEYVRAKGNFNLYGDKRCLLNVKSTENIDLETAQTIVNPLQDVLKLYFGPVPVMKINGIGNIDINVSGNRAEPNITGAFNFRSGTASFVEMPDIVVKNMEGKLSFSGEDTLFETKNATLNSRPVNIKGACSLYGKFDFSADTVSQNLATVFSEIKDSPMLDVFKIYFEKLNKVSGTGDVKLRIYGNLKNVHDMKINKNTFVDTDLTLNSAGIKIKDLPVELSNIFGPVSLKREDLLLNLYAVINKSKIYIDGKIRGDNADIAVKGDDFRVIDLTMLLPADIQRTILTFLKSDDFINFLPTLYTDFKLKYSGGVKNINYDNIFLDGKLTSANKQFKDVKYLLNHSDLKFTDFILNLDSLNLKTGGAVYNLFSPKRSVSAIFNLKDFDLENINVDTLKHAGLFASYADDIEQMSGKINVAMRVQNNNLNGNCNLENIKIGSGRKFNEILSGKLNFRNNVLYADKVNARIYEMPVMLDGHAGFSGNRLSNYNFNLMAKPVQDFLDETFNKNALYPVKVKGNVSVNTKVTGSGNNLGIKSDVLLDKDASLYYLGATIGDKSDAVKINSDIAIGPKEIKINDINYNKVVQSLNDKESTIPVLKVSGAIDTQKDNVLKFNNLKIKSLLPVDAKIFNIIFRKPFVKEGVFTSDLILNGTSLKPEVLGKLDISSVSLPFFESNINSINMNFTPKHINVVSKGDVVTNEVDISARLKNDFTLPFVAEDVNVHLAELDLGQIHNKFKNIEETNFKIHNELFEFQPFDYTNFIIHNSTLTADRIVIDKIEAQNFSGNVEIDKDKVLNVKNFRFNMADGSVDGNITHRYDDNKLSLVMNLNQADAANIAETLFNLKGQIYGLANGKISLNCNAENEKVCLSTLSGDGYFDIQNGKMPKLGSLEYLLKAGNLINRGLTGLTINGVIDLLSPLKSGEFKNIKGDFKITDGVADDINIYSNGKDLNLYITGNYNLDNSIADFRVFGSLSKEVTTMINKVKNLSLNTLLKTIPMVNREKENEFSDEIAKIPMSNEINNIYRFFMVIINGDINESGFVKSFEWVD